MFVFTMLKFGYLNDYDFIFFSEEGTGKMVVDAV